MVDNIMEAPKPINNEIVMKIKENECPYTLTFCIESNSLVIKVSEDDSVPSIHYSIKLTLTDLAKQSKYLRILDTLEEVMPELNNLCKENSDFEYILQFKIIDETCCIIEDNTKLLKEYYMEITAGKGRKIKREEDPFFIKYNEIWEFLIDIDELIYFKIQYKEWFYFIKKNAVMKKQSALFKNLMFNPILFSAYHKDDIMNKFFTRKDQLKEVENIQVQISISNQINIILILIQTFFYNTLISGIYPLQFIYINYYETFSEKKADGVWLTDMAEAQAAAREQKKAIFVDFWGYFLQI